MKVMGAGAGPVPLKMLLVRMEGKVGELLIAQKLHWCLGRAVPVPGKGCASPCPHTAWGQPLPLGTLTERSMTSLALSWTEMVTS